MAKSSKKDHKEAEIEFVPDAWQRFERFIREIVKSGPQHRPRAAAKRKALKRTRSLSS